MKFLKYGLMLGALGLMASCASDNPDGPANPNQNSGQLADVYFSINIAQPGTRTATPNQGTEEGLDAYKENDINKILIVFANTDNKVITSHTITLESADQSKSHTEIFQLGQTELAEIKKLQNNTQVKLFVVVNPTADCTFTNGGDIQKELTLSANNATTYWDKTNGFLMTNADENYTHTIDVDGIKAGKYGKGKEVHDLGTVKVQRAAARLDVAKTTPANEIADDNVEVSFDGLALVNLNKKFYLFKQVGSNASTWTYFADENVSNWVIDPVQAKASITKDTPVGTLEGYFFDVASRQNVGDWTYEDFPTTNPDNSTINWGTGDTDATAAAKARDYYVWKYVTPNNVLGEDNQKNGNSTGIIFQAEMKLKTGKEATSLFPNTTWGTDPIFVYGGTVYGGFDDLKAVAANPTTPKDQGMAAVFNSITPSSGSDVTAEDVAKDSRFKMYTPSADNKYYCYYYYWIRHNNNGENDKMGNMEFQVVRNNIYKLAVTKVSDFGVPGTDKPDPGTPDENPDTEVNFSVSVQVIPWWVRVDDIEF